MDINAKRVLDSSILFKSWRLSKNEHFAVNIATFDWSGIEYIQEFRFRIPSPPE